jgi:hypothetical protein
MSLKINRFLVFLLAIISVLNFSLAFAQVTAGGGRYPYDKSILLEADLLWPGLKNSISDTEKMLRKEDPTKRSAKPPSQIFRSGCSSTDENCVDTLASASTQTNPLNIHNVSILDQGTYTSNALLNEARILEQGKMTNTSAYVYQATRALTNPALSQARNELISNTQQEFQSYVAAEESNKQTLSSLAGANDALEDCVQKQLAASAANTTPIDREFAVSFCYRNFNPATYSRVADLSKRQTGIGSNIDRVDNSNPDDELRLSDFLFNDGFNCNGALNAQERVKCNTSASNRFWFRMLFGDVVHQVIPNPQTDQYGQYQVKHTKVAPYPNCNAGFKDLTPAMADELRKFGCGGVQFAIHVLAAETLRMLFTYTRHQCREQALLSTLDAGRHVALWNREANHPVYSLVENGGFCDNPDPDLLHMKAFISLPDRVYPCEDMYHAFDVSRRIKYNAESTTEQQCEEELDPYKYTYADFNAFEGEYVKKVPQYKRMYIFYSTIKAAVHVLEIVKATRAELAAQQGSLDPIYLQQANELIDISLPQTFYTALEESKREFYKMLDTLRDDRQREQGNRGSVIALGAKAESNPTGLNE